MSDKFEQRITELEVQVAHTQHLVDQLNSVVTAQAKQIDRMTRTIGQLQQRIEDLKFKSEPQRDPLDEKPPHY